MTNTRAPKCNNCGSTNVEWRQSRAGKWYLAQLNDGIRGSVYSSGPHYTVCARILATKEHNAKIAEREAKLQAMFAAGDYAGMQAMMGTVTSD
jgi:hypothetical protein